MTTASITDESPSTSSTEPINPASVRGIKTVGQTLLSRILMQAINAGTGILTARLLLPAGRGELAAITLWSQFLAGLITFGLPSALIYYIRNRPRETKEILVNALLMSTLLSILAGVVGFAFMPTWLHQYPPWAIHSARWFLIVTPLVSAAVILRSALEATGSFTTSNLAQILNPTMTLLFLLVLLSFHHFDTFTAACAYIAAAIPVLVLLVWRAWHLFHGGIRCISLATSKLLLGYGIRSYGIDLLGTLALQVDQVLVVSFLRPRDLGIYVVMLSLSRTLNVFQSSVVMVLFPKAAGRAPGSAVALTVQAARVSALVTGLFAACIAMVGPVLLRVLYGSEYAHSVLSLRLLLLEVTLSGCVFVLAQAFMALGRPGMVTLLQGLGLALSVPLMLLLIPRWGIAGAAASLLLSTCARFIFICVSFKLTLRVPFPRLMPDKSDWILLRSALHHVGRRQTA